MMQRNVQSGFTLVELLVSMTIFSIVIALSTSTLLILIDANSKAQSIQLAMNNLSLAIDSMAREVRTGYGYHCRGGIGASNSATLNTSACPAGGNFLAFTEAGDSLTSGSNPEDKRIAYRYNATDETIERRLASGDWQQITSTDVRIIDASFLVTDTNTLGADGDDEQPVVTIVVSGEAGTLEGTTADFTFQTTVTQRPLDV